MAKPAWLIKGLRFLLHFAAGGLVSYATPRLLIALGVPLDEWIDKLASSGPEWLTSDALFWALVIVISLLVIPATYAIPYLWSARMKKSAWMTKDEAIPILQDYLRHHGVVDEQELRDMPCEIIRMASANGAIRVRGLIGNPSHIDRSDFWQHWPSPEETFLMRSAAATFLLKNPHQPVAYMGYATKRTTFEDSRIYGGMEEHKSEDTKFSRTTIASKPPKEEED